MFGIAVCTALAASFNVPGPRARELPPIRGGDSPVAAHPNLVNPPKGDAKRMGGANPF